MIGREDLEDAIIYSQLYTRAEKGRQGATELPQEGRKKICPFLSTSQSQRVARLHFDFGILLYCCDNVPARSGFVARLKIQDDRDSSDSTSWM